MNNLFKTIIPLVAFIILAVVISGCGSSASTSSDENKKNDNGSYGTADYTGADVCAKNAAQYLYEALEDYEDFDETFDGADDTNITNLMLGNGGEFCEEEDANGIVIGEKLGNAGNTCVGYAGNNGWCVMAKTADNASVYMILNPTDPDMRGEPRRVCKTLSSDGCKDGKW